MPVKKFAAPLINTASSSVLIGRMEQRAAVERDCDATGGCSSVGCRWKKVFVWLGVVVELKVALIGQRRI